MGAGKTTFIKRFAENEDGFAIFDLDEEIAKHLNISPSSLGEFINTNGLEKFRDLEQEILKNLLQKRIRKIIALGGGTLESERIFEIVNQGRMVFLDVPFDVCFERIKNDKNRPVAQRPQEELKMIFEARRQQYLKSNLILTPEQIKGIDTIATLVHNL